MDLQLLEIKYEKEKKVHVCMYNAIHVHMCKAAATLRNYWLFCVCFSSQKVEMLEAELSQHSTSNVLSPSLQSQQQSLSTSRVCTM